MELYIRDNFFNSGTTVIMDEFGQPAGTLDLRSALTSTLDVYDAGGVKVCTGKFRLLSSKWGITDREGHPVGIVRERISFLSKRFQYDAGARGVYEITSPVFSKEYDVYGS